MAPFLQIISTCICTEWNLIYLCRFSEINNKTNFENWLIIIFIIEVLNYDNNLIVVVFLEENNGTFTFNFFNKCGFIHFYFLSIIISVDFCAICD